MIEPSHLEGLLRESYGTIAVDVLEGGTLRLILPDTREIHGSLVLSLDALPEGGWLISDGGRTSFSVGDEFDSVVASLRCGGMETDVLGETVLARTVSDDEELGTAVLAFASHVAGAAAMHRARQCWVEEVQGDRREPSTALMARETRSTIRREVPELGALVQLNYQVSGRGQSTSAPLAIVRSPAAKTPPPLVASFIDLTAPAASSTQAKRSASFLFDLVSDTRGVQKFVVARGPDEGLRDIRRFYEHENAFTVSTDDPEPLLESARELVTAFGL